MVSGEAQAVVFATGMHSEFGKIAHLTQTGREAVSPLRKQIAYLSRLIGILAVAIGLIPTAGAGSESCSFGYIRTDAVVLL